MAFKLELAKRGADLLSGGVAGALDQVFMNRDNSEEDRRHKLLATDKAFLAANKKLPLMARFGTYYNFGVPVAAIIASSMGWIKDDWAVRAVTIGGTLAGREAVDDATSKVRPVPAAYSVWARENAAAKEAAAKNGGAQRYDVTTPSEILV